MKVYVIAFDYGHEGYAEPYRVFSDKQTASDWAEKNRDDILHQIRIFEFDLDADKDPAQIQ